MAWHFVPDTLKVYLYISDRAAARRILGAQRSDEDYRSISDPTRPILARRESEIIRFKKYYNVDIDDLRNYDVVIDTTFAPVDDVVKQISEFKNASKPACLIDPRNLVPTRRISPISSPGIARPRREHGKPSVSTPRSPYVPSMWTMFFTSSTVMHAPPPH